MGEENLKVIKINPYYVLTSEYSDFVISCAVKKDNHVPEMRRITHIIQKFIDSCEDITEIGPFIDNLIANK